MSNQVVTLATKRALPLLTAFMNYTVSLTFVNSGVDLALNSQNTIHMPEMFRFQIYISMKPWIKILIKHITYFKNMQPKIKDMHSWLINLK